MKKILMLPILLAIVLLVAPSCTHNPYLPPDTNEPIDTIPNNTQPCSQDTVYFENQVQPILVSNCAKPGCHDAVTRQDNYDFSSYNGFINTDAVSGGNLANSEMWEVINETDPDKIMPPPGNTPLTQQQKDFIRTWILQNAQNNGCTEASCDTTNISLSADVVPILQASCYGCHSASAAGISGAGINLETYATLSTWANNGKLACSVSHGSGCSPMPKGSAKMPACQVDKITAWINAGAPNN